MKRLRARSPWVAALCTSGKQSMDPICWTGNLRSRSISWSCVRSCRDSPLPSLCLRTQTWLTRHIDLHLFSSLFSASCHLFFWHRASMQQRRKPVLSVCWKATFTQLKQFAEQNVFLINTGTESTFFSSFFVGYESQKRIVN